MSADKTRRSLSPLDQSDDTITVDELFDLVDEALKRDSISEEDMKSLMICLNEVRVGPDFTKSVREEAEHLCAELEARFCLFCNEQFAEPVKDVRKMSFSTANKEAVDHLDIDGLLTESQITIDRDKVLGSGTFGVVYSGSKGGLPVAVKELKDGVSDVDRAAFINEAKILARIHHPYCCEYVGYLKNPFRIVTRRYPSNLCQLIQTRTLSVNGCFRIAYQLTCALHYLHSIGLLHRDMKTENVFIDEDGNVRVADFGLTVYAPDTVKDDGVPCGTFLFMAPEVLRRDPYNHKSEVYTLGMMLWELFTGRLAFDDIRQNSELFERQKAVPMLPVKESDYTSKPGCPKPPLKIFQLAEKCYSYEPENRPELSEVLREILNIGVHYVVNRSSTAEKFWKLVCLYTYRNKVLLPEFISNMKVKPRFDVAETMRKAVPPSWELMDINHYWNLCCWFPNFFRNPNAFSSMETFVRAEWFCSDEKQAECRLKGVTKGFVIRPSTSDPFPSPFTLCQKDETGTHLYHIDRHITPTSVTFSSTLTGDAEFASITTLVKYLIKKLGIPIAPKVDLRKMYDD